MPVMPAPVRDRPQRAGEATRHLPHHGDALLRLSPDVGEAEEIKRGAVCGRVRGPLRPFEAEVDEARLVGMEGDRARRLPSTAKTRLASRKFSNAITRSSAYRTRMARPFRRGLTSRSNHSSSTECR